MENKDAVLHALIAKRIDQLRIAQDNMHAAQEELRISQEALNREQGPKGEDGVDGKDGKDGEDGAPGKPPAHKWDGTKLALEKPDGKWGKAVDLQGPPGGVAVVTREVEKAPSFSYMPAGW